MSSIFMLAKNNEGDIYFLPRYSSMSCLPTCTVIQKDMYTFLHKPSEDELSSLIEITDTDEINKAYAKLFSVQNQLSLLFQALLLISENKQ